jgi:glycosyltransferase involved in cell wall biosynthesis
MQSSRIRAGSAALRVAIVTPYYRESLETLRRAHDSVLAQTHPATHFLIADGHPQDAVRQWRTPHIELSAAHDDWGDTPRAIGTIAALSEGYEAIAFLDADNWYRPHHVETMIAAHRQTGKSVILASRALYRLDLTYMYDFAESDGLADTNCFFLVGEAARMVPLMAIKPKAMADIGDRIFWKALKARGFDHVRVKEPTVAYVTNWQASYTAIGETPPPGATKNIVGEGMARWLAAATQQERDSWSIWLFGAPNRW